MKRADYVEGWSQDLRPIIDDDGKVIFTRDFASEQIELRKFAESIRGATRRLAVVG